MSDEKPVSPDASLVLGDDGNIFHVTGTTRIDRIEFDGRPVDRAHTGSVLRQDEAQDAQPNHDEGSRDRPDDK